MSDETRTCGCHWFTGGWDTTYCEVHGVIDLPEVQPSPTPPRADLPPRAEPCPVCDAGDHSLEGGGHLVDCPNRVTPVHPPRAEWVKLLRELSEQLRSRERARWRFDIPMEDADTLDAIADALKRERGDLGIVWAYLDDQIDNSPAFHDAMSALNRVRAAAREHEGEQETSVPLSVERAIRDLCDAADAFLRPATGMGVNIRSEQIAKAPYALKRLRAFLAARRSEHEGEEEKP